MSTFGKTSTGTKKAWPSCGKYSHNQMRNVDIEDVDAPMVMEVLNFWKGKLSMQRTMRSFLSGFFTWSIEKHRIARNPCLKLKNWLARPKPSAVYISDDHFAKTRETMLSYTYAKQDSEVITAKINHGSMIQCFVDLCYLICQRSTEI